MSDGLITHDKMAHFGETPWHGNSTPVTRPMNSGEALTVADKNWTVSLRPVYFHEREPQHADECPNKKDPGAVCTCTPSTPPYIMDSDHFVVVRDDVLVPLGIVGGRYVPVQNRDAFAFLDGIVGAQEAIIHTVGSIYNGRKVWILAQLPGYIQVKGDDVGKFLLLANAHDGSMSMTLRMTPVRVVCANTLSAALAGGGTAWSIRHTLSLPTKVEAAREALGLASERFAKVGELYVYLGDHNMTGPQIQEYLLRLFPDTDSETKEPVSGAEEIRDAIMNLFEGNGRGLNDPKIKYTAWAAYNAVTEYLNWQVGRKNKNDAKLQSIWFGRLGYKISTALVELMKVIGAPVPSDVRAIPESELDPGLLVKPAGAEPTIPITEPEDAADTSTGGGEGEGS